MSWMRPLNAGGLNWATRSPVARLTFAIERTVWPLSWEKPPAIHTVWPSPVESTEVTSPLTIGSKPALIVPEPFWNENTWLRLMTVWLFDGRNWVKLPPSTTVLPTSVMLST